MSRLLYEDEAVFLAHSVALEQEAAERLYELAEAMAVHNSRPLHDLLIELAGYSEQHAAEVANLAAGKALPTLQAWEYSWPEEESPEVFHYGSVHYLMTAEQVLQLALKVEQSAQNFYEGVAARSSDPGLRATAKNFAHEEQEHVEAVRARLQQLRSSAVRLDVTDFDPPHMPE